MALGVFFDGMVPNQRALALARQADDAGVESIWMAEHFCFRDAFTSCAAILGATRRLRIVPGPISPYVHHPMTMAMAAATLDELGPRRTGLHVGTGNLRALEEFGVRVTGPLQTIRETVMVIRDLLSGDVVHFEGSAFQVHGSKLEVVPTSTVPLSLSAIRPRMLALAGEIGDGVVLSAGISPDFVRHSLGLVRDASTTAGRPRDAVRSVGFVVASVSNDRAAALDAARTFMAYLFRQPALKADWEMTGIVPDHVAIFEALKVRDWDRARALVSDEVVQTYSATGTPQEFGDTLERYLRAGLNLPVILPLGAETDQATAIRVGIEVAGRAPC